MATTPVPTTTEPIESLSSEDIDQMVAMSDDTPEEVAVPETAAAPVTPPAAAPPVPATPATVAPVVAEPTTPAQPIVPASPDRPVPTATPSPTSAPSAEAPFDAAAFTQKRNELVSSIERTYALSPEDSAAMVTEPEKVLPKLAARVMVDAFGSAVQVIRQMIPQMVPHIIEQHIAARQQQDAVQTQFFAEYPHLAKAEYADAIARIATTYRAANPTAPLAQAIKEVGAMASMALGILPAATAQFAPVAPPLARSFIPAGVGGAAAVPSTPATSNPFAEMVEEFLKES